MVLRIAVQPGGCSGLRYELFFDDRTLDGDALVDFGGIGLAVDRMSQALPGRRDDRLRRHHREAGLHHRQPERAEAPAPAATRSTDLRPRARRTGPSPASLVVRPGGSVAGTFECRSTACLRSERRAHHRRRIHRHRPPHALPGAVHRLAAARPAGPGVAVVPGRRPGGPPRRGRRQHLPTAWVCSVPTRCWSARSAPTSPTTRPGCRGTASITDQVLTCARRADRPVRLHHRRRHEPDRVVLLRRDGAGRPDRAGADRATRSAASTW